MKKFMELLNEAKVVVDDNTITITVTKAVGTEMVDGTFDVSETDYGTIKGNKLTLNKKDIPSLVSRLQDNYHKDYGFEEIKPALKRKMLELAKLISAYA